MRPANDGVWFGHRILPATVAPRHGSPGMRKWHRVAVGVLVVMLTASAAAAAGPDLSAQRLLSSWQEGDAPMKMIAELIASASPAGSLGAGTPPGSALIALSPISRGVKS
jgi:hypothetical protein